MMFKYYKCPNCNGTGRVGEIREDVIGVAKSLLSQDSRRDIYEANGGGFYISYSEGIRTPILNKLEVDELCRDGIIYEEPSCKGWFKQVTPPKQ